MRFEFIADRPVLDFLPTLAERGTGDIEALVGPGDLATWMVESGLVDRAPRVSAAQLTEAIAVRDAMFRLVAALIDHTRPTAGDLSLVNATAAGPLPVLRVDARGRLHRSADVEAVLALLARDCLDLFGSPDQRLMRWCADERCTRAFVDRSRGGRRRWCDVRSCGDKARASAYRERHRTTDPDRGA